MVDKCCEITCLLALVKERKVEKLMPVPFYCDNKSANHIASNSLIHERAKNIETEWHIVQQKMIQGVIATSRLHS